MEDAETCTAIECGLVEKASVIESGKYNLLVDLESCISSLLLCCQIVGRKHLVEYFVRTHFFKYLIRVLIDGAFLPT